LVTKNIEQLCEERNRSSHFLPFFRDQKPETTVLKKEEHFVVANNWRQLRRDSLFKEEGQMLEQMQLRLEELKKEFEIGRNRLQETE
jgi:hypothetical protein